MSGERTEKIEIEMDKTELLYHLIERVAVTFAEALGHMDKGIHISLIVEPAVKKRD